jgi:uncharacterized HAD superfamily protein
MTIAGLFKNKRHKTQMNFVNYCELTKDVVSWSKALPRDFDLIIGIPRSGIFPALMLSLQFNIPLSEINLFATEEKILSYGHHRKIKLSRKISKILVIDDSICRGKEMKRARKLLQEKSKKYEIKYSVVYACPGKESEIDFFFKTIDFPRCFEWNIMHHTQILNESCVDVDGVLCEDPTEEQNDDGARYMDFLANAKPIYIPTIRIKYLITCRLEKYRRETEEWLSKYNIKYDQLIMMDYPDKKARVRAKNYDKFKADFYKKTDCVLFIESSKLWAEKIAKLSKKPVLCTEDMKMYHF